MAYLGVSTSHVDPQLAAHLALSEGTGLYLLRVVKDGPAAKAGFAAGDVLLRLADQILINDAQLRVLLAGRKPGETVTVAYLRKGIASSATVTLGSQKRSKAIRIVDLARRIPAHRAPGRLGREGSLEHNVFILPNGEEDEFFAEPGRRLHLRRRIRLPGRILRKLPKESRKLVERLIKEEEKSIELELEDRPQGKKAKAVMSDGEHTLTLTRDQKGAHLLVKGKKGQLLFDGNVDSDKARSRIPAKIQEKLKLLEGRTKRQLGWIPKDFEKSMERLERELEDGAEARRPLRRRIKKLLKHTDDGFEFEGFDLGQARREIDEALKKARKALKKAKDLGKWESFGELEKEIRKALSKDQKKFRKLRVRAELFGDLDKELRKGGKNALSVLSIADDEHVIRVTVSAAGKKMLRVTDKAGKLIFEGPINSKSERAKLAPAIAKKLEGLHIEALGGKDRLRIRVEAKSEAKQSSAPKKSSPKSDAAGKSGGSF